MMPLWQAGLKNLALSFAFLVAASPSAGAQTASGPHSGGIFKAVAAAAAGTIDPQLNYTLEYAQVFALTNDGLVTFRKAGGAAGNEVVADLAAAVPVPTDGGKTYVFTLRQGIRFSNGAPVTPEDVVASYERLFKVHNANASSWYGDVVGADACIATPATCSLPQGVVADDAANTVTFHLTHPNAEFLLQLALPFGVVLPAATPAHDVGTVPLPATGAYMIASYDPQHEMVIKRNPYFKPWSDAAQPAGNVDEIDYSFGVTDENAVTAIENGQYDWEFDPLPSDRLAEVATRFGPQIHIDPVYADYYAPMNVNIAPFNNKDARLAVNYALDRKAMVQIFGGRALAVPSCQVLPPGFPAYQPYCPYTLDPGAKWSAPDMAKAQQLMAASGQIGQHVTVLSDDLSPDPALATYLSSLLNKLGFVATTHVLSGDVEFPYVQNTNNHVQISITQWYDDYPAPSDFLNVLFTCGEFHPGSDASVNIAGYCNKDYDTAVNQALVTATADPASANAQWASIDKMATDSAAWATLFAPRYVDFVSRRLGGFAFNEQYHMLFDKIWVR
jgi:peptide/nickel transport system substrate-binding protein